MRDRPTERRKESSCTWVDEAADTKTWSSTKQTSLMGSDTRTILLFLTPFEGFRMKSSPSSLPIHTVVFWAALETTSLSESDEFELLPGLEGEKEEDLESCIQPVSSPLTSLDFFL